MDTNIDVLKIKIDQAKAGLTEETKQAINAVGWKDVILKMRAEKGYSFEQLEDLETETELLLCGLVEPENYPKELEKRIGLPKPQIDELVNEMNEKIFKKIREELIKNLDKNKSTTNNQPQITNLKENPNINKLETREKILEEIENTDLTAQKELPAPAMAEPITNQESQTSNKEQSILAQKLSGSFQIPIAQTDHTLNNITKPKVDPYREAIE